MLWPLGQIEDRLVGQVRRLGQARHRRDRRRRAGRDHEALGLHQPARDLDLARPGEARRRAQHLNAQTRKARLQVVRRDRGDHAVQVGVDGGEIDRGLVTVDPEAAGGADRLRRLAGGDQGFGRHAAVVQAVAAHLALFDQHDLGAHLDGARGDRETAGAGADDAKIGRDRSGHCPTLVSWVSSPPSR